MKVSSRVSIEGCCFNRGRLCLTLEDKYGIAFDEQVIDGWTDDFEEEAENFIKRMRELTRADVWAIHYGLLRDIDEAETSGKIWGEEGSTKEDIVIHLANNKAIVGISIVDKE